jgi:hypothetical protein
MGIVALYSVDSPGAAARIPLTVSQADGVLADVTDAFRAFFDTVPYTWAVVGFSGGIGTHNMLGIHCGGEPTKQWSLEQQFSAWPKDLAGLSGDPTLRSFYGSKDSLLEGAKLLRDCPPSRLLE